MKTILVTGFEPFGGSHVNPSIAACRLLDGKEYNRYKVKVIEIPLVYDEIRSSILNAINETKPSAVICTGQGGGPTINLERVAINVASARIPYNCGKQPVDEPIVEDGPVAYFSTLPLRDILARITDAYVPVKISNSAGTFGCNHIFYELMHHIENEELGIPGGFIHVPSLPEQAMKRQVPSMSLDTISTAIGKAVEVVSASLP